MSLIDMRDVALDSEIWVCAFQYCASDDFRCNDAPDWIKCAIENGIMSEDLGGDIFVQYMDGRVKKVLDGDYIVAFSCISASPKIRMHGVTRIGVENSSIFERYFASVGNGVYALNVNELRDYIKQSKSSDERNGGE